MTNLLASIIGRMPIGWLQLTHSKGRMIAAIAGVAFANILVFVQLGILGALNGTISSTYDPFRADLIISSSDANTLTDGSPLSRRIMWQVLSIQGVQAASPLYIGKSDWKSPDGNTASLNIYGLPVEAEQFQGEILKEQLKNLSLPDTILLDRLTRGIDKDLVNQLTQDQTISIELNGRSLNTIGSVSLGGGFSADGTLVTSDQTFLRLLPKYSSGTPSIILVDLEDAANIDQVINSIRRVLSEEPVLVRSLQAAKEADKKYQTTQRPIGVIFGFGTFIGLLVGLIIVYQVLSTDVADHLHEYATFKAMGYPHSFFFGIVFEEANILAILGFIPGLLIVLIIYYFMASATGLQVEMDSVRAISLFLGTVIACTISGALATRRLKAADPAELF